MSIEDFRKSEHIQKLLSDGAIEFGNMTPAKTMDITGPFGKALRKDAWASVSKWHASHPNEIWELVSLEIPKDILIEKFPDGNVYFVRGTDGPAWYAIAKLKEKVVADAPPITHVVTNSTPAQAPAVFAESIDPILKAWASSKGLQIVISPEQYDEIQKLHAKYNEDMKKQLESLAKNGYKVF